MQLDSSGFRAAAAAAFAAGSLGAAGVELTEQEAVGRALSRPAHAELEDGRLAAARGAVREAERWRNPVLSLEQERMPVAGGRSTERSIQIAQTFDVSGRRALRADAAGQRLAAAQHESRDRRLQIATEVRRTFAEALSREREQQALAAWLKRIESASDTVARLAKSGEVAGYARRRMEREVQSARARLAAAAGSALLARERLRGLVGLEPAEEMRLAGDLAPPELPPLAATLATARERPDLAALLAQAEAFERERSAAAREWAPDLTLGVGQKRAEEPLRSDTGMILRLSFPLPLFDRGESRRDIAGARAKALRAEHRLLAERREAEIRGLWRQAGELRAGAIAMRGAPMGELSRTAEAAYRAGEGGILELLDAYRAELDAELATLELELRARSARIDLDASAGVDRAN
jgi:cobalt-zinc-cadmium efflux system outer membrane protein